MARQHAARLTELHAGGGARWRVAGNPAGAAVFRERRRRERARKREAFAILVRFGGARCGTALALLEGVVVIRRP